MQNLLLILCGVPGSGKTTVAALVSRRLRAVHLQSDAIRAMVAEPRYTSRESRFVYRALIAAGREALLAGYDTILDATFPKEEFRSEATEALRGCYGSSLLARLHCDPRTAYARNLERDHPVPRRSFERIAEEFEPLRGGLTLYSTHASPEELADRLLRRIQQLRT